jgi:hypothetical protein
MFDWESFLMGILVGAVAMVLLQIYFMVND